MGSYGRDLTGMCGPGYDFQNLTNTTQNKTTRDRDVNIEIHRLGPKSDKHRLGQRDSEGMEAGRSLRCHTRHLLSTQRSP